jgi:hypothetical protein
MMLYISWMTSSGSDWGLVGVWGSGVFIGVSSVGGVGDGEGLEPVHDGVAGVVDPAATLTLTGADEGGAGAGVPPVSESLLFHAESLSELFR